MRQARATDRPARAAPHAGAPAAPLRQLRLLGTAAWRVDEGPWHALARKDAALLARLALDGPQSRTGMAAWLWPEVALPGAHANLRQRLFRLRRQAGPLVQEDEGRLQLHHGVVCDLSRDGCDDAADLNAPLLAGLEERDDPLQAWLDAARQQWQAQRADVISGLASRHEAAGKLAAAIALCEGLLLQEPLLEHAWRRLMRLHMLRGDRAAALAAFERCEQVLRDELGVRPAPETLALLHRAETAAAPSGKHTSVAPIALPLALMQPPPLVGRDAERRTMAQAWALGRPFVLIGEAGLGKTRLLLECVATGPARVIDAARPGDEAVPYATLVRLLRNLARVAPRPDALWPQATTPAGAEERQELARLLPELGPAPPAPGLQALLLGALEQVFARAAVAGVQAVLLDDLQHADEATHALLRRVAGQPGLLWGFATRPPAQAEASAAPRPGNGATRLDAWLATSTRVQAVVLQGLSVPALRSLLQALAVPGLNDPDLAPALARHCGGNPLFVLETLRHRLLHAPAAERAAAGATAPDAALPADTALPLPPTVQALLQNRLAALSAPAQALARVAAVAGADFTADLAAEVLQQSLLDLTEAWRELETAQVLRGDGFVHETMLETARASLPAALQRPLHARVARCLLKQQAPARRVAAHFAAGGLPEQAGPMALAAAQQARRVGRLQERVECLDQAARWFDEAGLADAAFEARCESCTALYALSGAGPSLALLDALLPQARRRSTRVQLQLTRAGVTLAQYDMAASLAAAQAALAEAEPGSAEALSAQLLAHAARALQGDAIRQRSSAMPLRERLIALDDPLVATELWGYLALVCTLAGDSEQGLQALQMQARLARQTGKTDDEANALTSLVALYTQQGDGARAVQAGQRAVALQTRLGAELNTVGALVNLALAQIGQFVLGEAWQALQQARAGCAALGAEAAELAHIAADAEAEIWLRADQPRRAMALVQADTAGVSTPRCVARWTLRARACAALDDTAQAARLWHQVLQAQPGTATVLRAQWLAVQGLGELGLGEQGWAHLPALQAQTQAMPPALQALALWVQADAAWQQGHAEQALAGARALRLRLPQARHAQVPEARMRRWLVQCLQATAPAAEAAAEQAAWVQWHQQVWQAAVAALPSQDGPG